MIMQQDMTLACSLPCSSNPQSCKGECQWEGLSHCFSANVFFPSGPSHLRNSPWAPVTSCPTITTVLVMAAGKLCLPQSSCPHKRPWCQARPPRVLQWQPLRRRQWHLLLPWRGGSCPRTSHTCDPALGYLAIYVSRATWLLFLLGLPLGRVWPNL